MHKSKTGPPRCFQLASGWTLSFLALMTTSRGALSRVRGAEAGLPEGLRSLLQIPVVPTEGTRPGCAQPCLGQRGRRRRWRPGFPIRVIPSMDRAGCRAGRHRILLFPRLLLVLLAPAWEPPGKRQQGPPTSHSWRRPTSSVPHTLQPKVLPQDCSSLNEQETASCLELANPTTAGVFCPFSQPPQLFQGNHQ